MVINIIHNNNRTDRFNLLQKEIKQEGLEVIYWPAMMLQSAKLGIMRAHKQIVYDAKMRQLDMVCIAEDDLRFTYQGAWKYFLGNMPQDFDIYLASVYWGEIKERNRVAAFSGLSLYVVKRHFFDTFLSIQEGKHLDMELKNKGDYYVCNPFAAIQHETYSDNNKKNLNNARWLGKRKLFGGYENGQTKIISYDQLEILSKQGLETLQAGT